MNERTAQGRGMIVGGHRFLLHPPAPPDTGRFAGQPCVRTSATNSKFPGKIVRLGDAAAVQSEPKSFRSTKNSVELLPGTVVKSSERYSSLDNFLVEKLRTLRKLGKIQEIGKLRKLGKIRKNSGN